MDWILSQICYEYFDFCAFCSSTCLFTLYISQTTKHILIKFSFGVYTESCQANLIWFVLVHFVLSVSWTSSDLLRMVNLCVAWTFSLKVHTFHFQTILTWCICNEIKVKVMHGSAAVGFVSNMSVSAINWCEDKWQVQSPTFGKYMHGNEMRVSTLVLIWIFSGSCGILAMKVWHCKIVIT